MNTLLKKCLIIIVFVVLIVQQSLAGTTPPEDIDDLSVTCTSNYCDLTWTAPGDDGATGTATSYDIRYNTDAAINTDSWDPVLMKKLYWDTNTVTNGPFTVGETVTGGTSSATGKVHMVFDSDDYIIVSNVTGYFVHSEVITGGTSGAYVTLDHNSVPAPYGVTNSYHSCVNVQAEPSPSVAGTSETFRMRYLKPDTTYYFAIVTIDDNGNESGISNVDSDTTAAESDLNQKYTYGIINAAHRLWEQKVEIYHGGQDRTFYGFSGMETVKTDDGDPRLYDTDSNYVLEPHIFVEHEDSIGFPGVVHGFVQAYEATGDKAILRMIKELGDTILQAQTDNGTGGWFYDMGPEGTEGTYNTFRNIFAYGGECLNGDEWQDIATNDGASYLYAMALLEIERALPSGDTDKGGKYLTGAKNYADAIVGHKDEQATELFYPYGDGGVPQFFPFNTMRNRNPVDMSYGGCGVDDGDPPQSDITKYPVGFRDYPHNVMITINDNAMPNALFFLYEFWKEATTNSALSGTASTYLTNIRLHVDYALARFNDFDDTDGRGDWCDAYYVQDGSANEDKCAWLRAMEPPAFAPMYRMDDALAGWYLLETDSTRKTNIENALIGRLRFYNEVAVRINGNSTYFDIVKSDGSDPSAIYPATTWTTANSGNYDSEDPLTWYYWISINHDSANGTVGIPTSATMYHQNRSIRIDYSGISGGPFQVGETVTGGTSGKVGTVSEIGTGGDANSIRVTPNTAVGWTNGETITGGTSSATATVTSSDAVKTLNCDRFYYQYWGTNAVVTDDPDYDIDMPHYNPTAWPVFQGSNAGLTQKIIYFLEESAGPTYAFDWDDPLLDTYYRCDDIETRFWHAAIFPSLANAATAYTDLERDGFFVNWTARPYQYIDMDPTSATTDYRYYNVSHNRYFGERADYLSFGVSNAAGTITDTDGDGLTDAFELAQNSDPYDSEDYTAGSPSSSLSTTGTGVVGTTFGTGAATTTVGD